MITDQSLTSIHTLDGEKTPTQSQILFRYTNTNQRYYLSYSGTAAVAYKRLSITSDTSHIVTARQCTQRKRTRVRSPLLRPRRSFMYLEDTRNHFTVTPARNSLPHKLILNALHQRPHVAGNPAAHQLRNLVRRPRSSVVAS